MTPSGGGEQNRWLLILKNESAPDSINTGGLGHEATRESSFRKCQEADVGRGVQRARAPHRLLMQDETGGASTIWAVTGDEPATDEFRIQSKRVCRRECWRS